MRGDIRDKALGLLEPLYQAEFATDGWSTFLLELMGAMQSDVAIAVTLDRQARPVEFLTQGIFSPDMAADYLTHFAAIDPWADAFLTSKQPLGKNVSSQELLDPRDFEQTEYYNDFWRPNHDLFFTCGALIEVDGGFANVGFPRCRDRGAYDRSDIALLDVMSPHISAALRLHQRLNRANQAAANAEAALDRMHDAMLVVDSAGSIVYANPAADAELAAGTHLSCRNSRLMAGPLVAQDELERAFHAAAGISQRVATQIPAALASRELDPALRASIAFYPLPAGSHDPMALRRASVLVVLCRKHGGRTLSVALLRRLYGLTPTEARIAQMLSRGQSLEEIAAILQIRVGTARSHLKQVFQKTGTRRQGQLASVLDSMQPRIID